MQKTCSYCRIPKNFAEFNVRKASRDGLAPACRVCLNAEKWHRYQTSESDRTATLLRVRANRQDRFERDPAYKRAFTLWGSTKKRGTKIPPWVAIMDFVPVCQEAIDAGPGFELDHIIPLKGKQVCGLHVPENLRVVPTRVNQAKHNKHEP